MSNKPLDDCLDSALEAYSAAAESACGSRSPRYRKWSIYAAATGSALAMATSADASIITGFSGATTSANRAAASTFATTLAVSFGSLGQLRLGANWFQSPGSTSASVLLGAFGGARLLRTSFGDIRRFNSGAVISNGLATWGHSGTVAANCGCGLIGEFASGSTGFAAFQLAGGELGWIQLKWESSLHDNLPDTLTAYNWAYEDVPGVSITTAPEPGTFPMAVLAAGAAGIVALRKRRRKTPEATPAQSE